MGKMKFQVGDRVRANEKAPGDYEGRDGVVTDRSLESQYQVEFAPLVGNASFGCLYSWQLDHVQPVDVTVHG